MNGRFCGKLLQANEHISEMGQSSSEQIQAKLMSQLSDTDPMKYGTLHAPPQSPLAILPQIILSYNLRLDYIARW